MSQGSRTRTAVVAGALVALATTLFLGGATAAAPSAHPVLAVPAEPLVAASPVSLAPQYVPPPPSAESPTPTPAPATTAAAAPKPAPTVAWAACSATLGGVTVHVAAAQRTVTIVNGKGGSYATLSFYRRTTTSACGFTTVFTDSGARVGSGGITDGATRTQGTGTTPTGTYTMTEAFGLKASPGTALTYRHVKAGDYWVEDNNSAYYNSYRNVSQGGFDASLPLSDANGSELLTNYPTQYAYSIVVNFNRAPDAKVPYRGAGIFVHVRTGATAGCIATSAANVVTMLRTMRPGDTITIVP